MKLLVLRSKLLRRVAKSVIFLFSAGLICATLGCQKTLLPPDVAGTWKAKDNPWKIVLSPDGILSSAIIPMGEVRIRPNKTTTAEMKDGSISTFEAGDCVVEYNSKTRELFVSVEMKQIHIKFQNNEIKGNSIDRFFGPVSEDGKYWKADWVTVFDYGPLFPQDQNDIFAVPIVFEKVKE